MQCVDRPLRPDKQVARWDVVTVAAVVLLFGCSGLHGKELPKWEVGMGVGGMRLPDYRGSDEYRNYPLPLPYVIYRGERLQLDRRGATGVLFESDRLELDVSASAANPVRSGRNRAREGMPGLDPTVEFGPRLRYTMLESATKDLKVSVELPVRAIFSLDSTFAHRGWIANPTVNLDVRNVGGSGWNFGTQAGPVYGDRRYHGYFYDVAAPYARPDRPAYRANAGYSGAHLSAALSKRYASTWVGGFMRAYTLHGAAFEGSPLVRTRTALLVGVGFAYIFATSSTLVLADE
jgi:MipA family protein